MTTPVPPTPTPSGTPRPSPTSPSPSEPPRPSPSVPTLPSAGPRGPGTPTTEVYGSTFTKAAGAFLAERAELETATLRIIDAIGALGDFAGTDETANTFRKSFSTAMEKAKAYVEALCDVYPPVADRLADMKTSFDVANWATIESLPKVSDPPKLSPKDGQFT
ncbi:hypothetical protein [Nonomuraea sp. NPDC052265]|uniref:hypothetical protein n=1 Tax=Nonomuraea sp. NPDC052265 TaxID=3364374 RepID=UPI0037CB02AE